MGPRGLHAMTEEFLEDFASVLIHVASKYGSLHLQDQIYCDTGCLL